MNTQELIEAAAAEYGIPPAQILGKGRSQMVVGARRKVIKAMYDAGKSAQKIADELGKDRTSIYHALSMPNKRPPDCVPVPPTMFEQVEFDRAMAGHMFDDYEPATRTPKGATPRICRYHYPSEKSEHGTNQSSLQGMF